MEKFSLDFYDKKRDLIGYFIEYLYMTGVVCKECTIRKKAIDYNVDKMIELYNEIKEFDQVKNFQSLLFEDKNTINYFVDQLEHYCESFENDINKYKTLNDIGRVYDNSYTQYRGIEPEMKNLYYFINYDGVKNTIRIYRNNSESSNKLVKSESHSEITEPPTTIEQPFENKQRDDFIILKMLATNEIEIIDGVFFYKSREYARGNSLNKVINENKGYKPLKKFTQYLNDFKNRTGDKYYLDLIDSVNNKANNTNIERLRKFKKYLKLNNIQVTNHDFKEAFERI
jgi:hypothetical protein